MDTVSLVIGMLVGAAVGALGASLAARGALSAARAVVDFPLTPESNLLRVVCDTSASKRV